MRLPELPVAKSDDVIQLLQTIARRAAGIIQNVSTETALSTLLDVDQEIGYLAYQASRVRAQSDCLPDEAFGPELAAQVAWLRSTAFTALGNKQLYPTERATWVAELDDVSSSAFRTAEALSVADAALRREEELRATAQQLRKRRLREAGTFHDQLKMVAGGLAPADQVEEVLTEEQQEERKLRRRRLAKAAWYDKEAFKLRESGRFTVELLPGNEGAGVTAYPVVLAQYSLSNTAEEALAEAGIKIARIFGSYRQIHNCRMMGIPNGVLPGNLQYSRQIAHEFLERLQQHPKWGRYTRGFYIAPALPHTTGKHTYFILLPESCRALVEIEQWDFGNPPKQQR